MVNEPAMKKPEKARMEVHDRFIDIHVPLLAMTGVPASRPSAMLMPKFS